jgi:hypothetical protein
MEEIVKLLIMYEKLFHILVASSFLDPNFVCSSELRSHTSIYIYVFSLERETKFHTRIKHRSYNVDK